MEKLVRCKDCKFKYCPNTLEMYKVPDDQLWCSEVDTDPDDYCSMGERRENTELKENVIPIELLKEKIAENPLSQIENATTVEAIPVEWIRKFRRNYWLTSGAPIEERTVVAIGVRKMLEAWEEENEKAEL